MRKFLTACMALVAVTVLAGCGKKEEKQGVKITGPDGKEVKVEVTK